MNIDVATYVFASYMNHNTLTLATIKKFIALGVDINKKSEGYWTDGHDDNALSTAAEYRRKEDIKVLLACGADISAQEDIVLIFISGHSALYCQIVSQEDLISIIEGIEVLLDAGANLTQEAIDFVHDEFYKNEFQDSFEQFLEETYSQKQNTT